MNPFAWPRLSLIERVRWLRYGLPPLLVLWVVVYQLAFAQQLEAAYGHAVHYSVEIAFYSLAGPVVTWLTLAWVERNLKEKERLERQIQTAQREKAAVLEEERARIARDLHDGVAQNLYFLALKSDMLRQSLATGTPEAGDELREMGQTMRHVIREVRRTIFALRPLDWTEVGFVQALRHFVAGYAEQMGWQATLSVADQLTNLPPELEPTVFRLVQESLNNVAKHAQASQVEVALKLAEEQALCLTVRDNGQGIQPNHETGKGFGLGQMRARVEAVGGSFRVESQPGQGTTTYTRIPLPGDDMRRAHQHE